MCIGLVWFTLADSSVSPNFHFAGDHTLEFLNLTFGNNLCCSVIIMISMALLADGKLATLGACHGQGPGPANDERRCLGPVPKRLANGLATESQVHPEVANVMPLGWDCLRRPTCFS